jgi:DNA-binding transcriptional regulator GbsR (MarR family)
MQTASSSELDMIEKKLIEIFMLFSKLRGRPPKMAAILAHCVVLGKVTQKQLRNLTKFSMGSISVYLNELEKNGTIEKNLDPESHNYIYSMKDNILGTTTQSAVSMPSLSSELKSFLTQEKQQLNLIPAEVCGYSFISEFLQSMQTSLLVLDNITKSLVQKLSPSTKSGEKKTGGS